MPPRPQASATANSPVPSPALNAAPDTAPDTVGARSHRRFLQTNPVEDRYQAVGLSDLSPLEKKAYVYSRLILPVARRTVPLSTKAERDFWKIVAKDALPARRLGSDYAWGTDRSGRDFASYRVDAFEQRRLALASLTALDIQHRQFLAARRLSAVTPADVDDEKKRRLSMAELKRQLYGEMTGPLANDPEWDDVVPIPQDDPDDALAKIAYPDDYAEAVSYLRAVMAAEECSPRCLRLTEHVIDMNPAHYTVWLYRFKIICALQQSVPEEMRWLDEVAMSHLKNYQIWHHRQLLLDHYYPTIAADADAVKRLTKSETDFITAILAEDTKNYHVWSYRQYLVAKLGLWTPSELGSTQSMIEDDLRNNSAWSHRFFVVFSDPSVSTSDAAPTAHDPKVPDSIIDRELAYAREKIALAPQNQSGWNYLRGVLAKGGRGLAATDQFASQFVSNLGEEGETVQSSHALDLLADAYREKGDTAKAKLCLQRLWEQWDPVREGYWKYRAAELEAH